LSRTCAPAALAVILFACGGPGATEPSPGGGGAPSSPPLSHLELFPAQRAAVVGDTITLKVIARDLAGADVSNVVPGLFQLERRRRAHRS
jgi:hypothetical protein